MITEIIDKIGQKIVIGNWITLVERGKKTVAFGKVVGFNPSGSPKYKESNKSRIKSPGYCKNWNSSGARQMESQFLKVEATRGMDLYYENN